jgi:sporulation protein YlmC with PRC-barrel domain
MTRIRVDDLLGRRVRDTQGRVVGRIYEMRVEEQGGDLVILEYHLGTRALLQRASISLLKLVGAGHAREPRKVPWNRMDVSDPFHPRLLGSIDEPD